MGDFNFMARFLIITGLLLVLFGLFLFLVGKIPYLGRLPGDIVIKKENFTFYFPLATCIVLSILFTLLLNLFFRR